ncbi:MAG TPA: hypothetical protein VJ124_06285 [Pyrinomonadaceae bacterium]|nr:hypothetical protein [Pyrinomonadaceae bacterium]
MASVAAAQLTLAPLGAGDLIDRAVRLYRRHLFTLIRIAAPPVLITALGSISWTISSRHLFSTTQTSALPFYIFLLLVAAGLIMGGHIFSLLVMGGAARNLVMHLLWNEPVSARATYAAVRSRFWALLGAMIIVVLWGSLSLIVSFGGWYMLILVAIMGSALLAAIAPIWLPIITGTLAVLMATALAVWLFFFMFGRVAYVPQALLVEGKGVFQSVGRSFALASGNIRRLMAVSLFTYFATWSALMILVIPLGWYGYLNGIDPSPWNATNWPAWYAIGYSVLEPLSSILLAPIWMLGLSLLYVDERVRHEGYDIELMASRQLDGMPQLNVSSPLGPAISLPEPTLATVRRSVLGLS